LCDSVFVTVGTAAAICEVLQDSCLHA